MTTTADRDRQSRRRRAAVIFLFVLSFAVLGGYALLGGFKEPNMAVVTIPGYMLAGKEFEGRSGAPELNEIFNKAKELNSTGQLPGTLAAIYYDAKEAEKGNVHTFAGVIVKDPIAQLPDGFVYRAVPAGKAVQAEIFAHYLVAPAPGRVQLDLAGFARQNGLKPARFVIEKYFGPSNIVLEIPVE
jgi:hypothetical protein